MIIGTFQELHFKILYYIDSRDLGDTQMYLTKKLES